MDLIFNDLGHSIAHADLGIMRYDAAHLLQQSLHADVCAGRRGDLILTVEHPSVLTLGKNSDHSHILASDLELKKRGVEVAMCERGGEVTAHTLGQLVVYPIIHLGNRSLGVRDYVCALETAVIRTLRSLGLECAAHKEFPGVWIQDRKVCAVGIRVKNRVSMHGIALNVNSDLSIFSLITPCGILGRTVTSLKQELKSEQDFVQIRRILVGQLAECIIEKSEKGGASCQS